jgi:hypothetical protein
MASAVNHPAYTMVIGSHFELPNAHEADLSTTAVFVECPLCADIVAKVFLRGGTQILRPVDAAIE